MEEIGTGMNGGDGGTQRRGAAADSEREGDPCGNGRQLGGGSAGSKVVAKMVREFG